MFDLKTHLQRLVETHAPSGHEAPMRAVLRDEWAGIVDSFDEDRMGSLIGIKRATRPPADGTPAPRIMLAAHTDEIALIVRDILDGGFLSVQSLSGMDGRLLPAQALIVHGRQRLPALVASVPPHLLSGVDTSKYTPISRLIVDTGLPADEVARLVTPGDLVTFDAPLISLLGTRVASKSMDDRASVAALTVCLQDLTDRHHRWDVYAVATAQEETGLRGAATAAYHIAPQIAIALDVTFAAQPGIDPDTAKEIGAGPVLAMGPNIHPKLLDVLRQTARDLNIPYQDEVIAGRSGTDAWAIQVAHEGVPTTLIGIALRSMHSAIEMVDLDDIRAAGRLLAGVIARLDADFVETLALD